MAEVARKLGSIGEMFSIGATRINTMVRIMPARLDCFLVMNKLKEGVVADYTIEG